MGLILVALNAGISPIIVPNTTNTNKAIKTTAIETDALINVASSPCPHALSIAIRIHPPVIIPKIPETKVKKTASTTICLLISKGVAPSCSSNSYLFSSFFYCYQ